MTPLIFNLGPSELLIILAIVLLLFGGSRLAGLGKSTGRALKEFKEETKGLKGGDTTPPSVTGATGQNPYETEAGSTFIQSPQSASPYVAPPQGGTPYTQPPQQQEQVHYDVPPTTGQPPTNGTPYGQQPQVHPTERDARRDV